MKIDAMCLKRIFASLVSVFAFICVVKANADIFTAVKSGNVELCVQYLQQGGDVNACDSVRNTLLMYAAENASYRVAHLLLKNGADVSYSNTDGKTALDIANEVGLRRMISLLKNVNTYSEKPTGEEIASLVFKLINENNLDEALELSIYEVKILDKEWIKSSKNYASAWEHQGIIYLKQGRYKDAEQAMLKVCEHLKRFCPNTQWYYYGLSGLALIYINQFRIDDALELLNECVQNDSIIQRPNILCQVYANRAAAYTYKGLYKEAENDYNSELNFIDFLPEQQRNSAYANVVGNRSLMYYSMGTPEALHQYASEAPNLLKFMVDHNIYNLDYIIFKQNWCIYMATYGDIKEAYNTAKELQQEIKDLLGCAHENYVENLNIIGSVSTRLGLFDEALNAFSEALSIMQNHPISHRKQAAVYHSLASLEDIIGEADLAEMDHVQAMEKSLEVCGYYSTDYLTAVGGYAEHLLISQKAPERALLYAKQSLEISKKLCGESSFITLDYQRILWIAYGAIQNLKDSAYFELKDYDKNMRCFLQNTIGVVPETQWEGMWKGTLSSTYSVQIPNFLIEYSQKNQEAQGDLYDNELLAKGVLLYGAERLNRVFSNHEDASIVEDWNRIKDIKKLLSNSKFISDSLQCQLQLQKKTIENSIISKTKVKANLFGDFDVSWRDIRGVLSEREAAIEFSLLIHWGSSEETDEAMFYAYVLTKNSAYPHIVPLFNLSEFDNLRRFSSVASMCDYKYFGDYAYNLIWGKIMPYVEDCDKMYFALESVLSGLALENFPISQDSTIGEKYHLIRMTSTGELLKKSDSLPHEVDMALFGGIQYTMSENQMQEERVRLCYPKTIAMRSVGNSIDRGTVSYLPATLKEVNAIAKEASLHGLAPVVYSGIRANEESIIMLSGKKSRLLHIATHGFYWSEEEARAQKVFDSKNNDIKNKIEDPLSRCGLLFAGANIALSGYSEKLPIDVNDGILTAREISNLDLSNTDLVVLSACNTGIGDITNDGVAGLQRGFKMAGVNSIMMSLWPVDDAATYLLMTEFYKNYLGGKTKTESLREAQRYLRNYEQDGEKIFADPKYWAAFVLLDALD